MSLNKVMLIGNIGSDLELKVSQNQVAYCQFSVATNETVQSAQGTPGKRTEWHTVITFGRTASNCVKYLKKGSSVYIEGSLRSSDYTDPDGTRHKLTKIIPRIVSFLGKETRLREPLELEIVEHSHHEEELQSLS
jgi:single-strand DNA-binding protein